MNEMQPRGPKWRGAAVCIAVLVALACVLHHEVLFGGQVYHMDDAADGYYPGHIAVARAFAHGELPTWERGSWCGWPLVVDPYNGVFYPPNILYYIVGAARGLGYAIALHVVLGGVGVWLLLRRRRLSFEAALFGAIAYELSTFGVVRIRHVIFVQMMGWLPWILVGVEGWFATRRRRELVLVALATGLALVAGALSIGHFAALVIGGYALARAFGGRAFLDGAKDAGALALAALVGALTAAVQLAPTLAHLPHSPRHLASDYAFASSYAWPDLRYVGTLVAPDLFGGEERAGYFGAPNHWELAGWYSGALAVAFALFALGKPRSERRRGAELVVLWALVALAVGLALGDAAPVHRFFFHHVPLYAALRCPARALLACVLALPILGAHGVEAVLERARARRSWIGIAIAVAIAIGGLAGAWKLEHLGRVPPQTAATATAFGHMTWVIALGAAIAVAALFGRLPRRIAGAGLALVAALDLLALGRSYVQPQPPDYPAGMERFAAVEWLAAHATGDRFVNDPGGPFRLHNVGMVLGLENASGYDSVAIWRYVDFLYLLANGRPYPEKKLKHDFAAIGVHGLDTPLIDMMNVRWLLAYDAPGPRWVERFHPKSPSGAPAAKYEPMWDPRLRVFENTRVLPRAFVVYHASVPASDARLAARLVDRRFDPATEILLEEAPPGPAAEALEGATRPMTPATVREAGRSRLAIDADADAPGVLFVGDTHYPGWRAFVDGKPAPLLRANWTFRGVPLPPGRHHVELVYSSRPVALGAILSALGLIATALLGLGRRRAMIRTL